ncbi:MAG TPA: FHA domain-containing protein [Vicinamibacterales bacterium]|jgi:hypothetical protein
MPGTERAGRLVVRLPDGRSLRLSAAFHIGRDASCEVVVTDNQVSRRHAVVSPEGGHWVVRDLQSSNGLFVDNKRVESAAIDRDTTVRLGVDGPVLRLAPEGAADPQTAIAASPQVPAAASPPSATGESLDAYAQRYFGSDEGDESVGGRTLMIRKAFQKVQQQQRRRTRATIALLALVALGVAAYALYEHRLVSQQSQVAEEWYYEMKEIDVRVAQLEQQAAASGAALGSQQLAGIAQDRQQREKRYDEVVAKLYDRKLNEKDRLILKVTRIFGECEVAAPADYLKEVHRYIDMWQRTGRFERAVRLSQDRGYIPRIATAFKAQNLPIQYYYLAMQESGFDAFTYGPPTRWGIAKGMWQFIPETAQTYGLRVGPRKGIAGFDAEDERFNWMKASDAAAKYIKNIYATDAQASGLLVIASYNWGEHRIIDRLRTMPADPRQRNFWRLLADHAVPDQTYNYVFYIVSAAVIGENPRLFGFNLDNPLKAFDTP